MAGISIYGELSFRLHFTLSFLSRARMDDANAKNADNKFQAPRSKAREEGCSGECLVFC